MKRRNFLSSLLGIPLIARFLPAAEAPKIFWAGTTIPRSEPIPQGYHYAYHFMNVASENVRLRSGMNDWTVNGQA
jgi:hypothetical protein